MIKREKYLNKIRPFVDDDLIKVITGIRRCGKSVIMQQIKEEVELKTDNIIYINLEDRKFRRIITDSDSLLKYIDLQKTNNDNDKWYIFIDEIQDLDSWAEACRSLRLENNSVFITGSNSKLLSKEFTSALSGRYISFRIRPFVYREACQYAKELNKEYTIDDYLIWGGFPKSLEYDGEYKINYLEDLVDTIIYNDLINRYKIRKIELFKSICEFIFKNNSRTISAKSLTDYINATSESCSIHTIMKFIDYVEMAFGIDKIQPYSLKAKRSLAYYSKIYAADVSFNSLTVINNRYDLDHNLENAVYNELIYMGYDVRVYRNEDNNEIDFFVSKAGKSHYVQVAYSVVDEKAYNREFKLFNKMDFTYDKVLITADNIDFSTSNVRHIKFKDFVLMDNL